VAGKSSKSDAAASASPDLDIKVLYVEDSRSSSSSLREALKDAGLTVVFCGGGFDALDELAADGADIVVSAAQVTDLSGYQLASIIKSSEVGRSMPVVLFRPKEQDEPDQFWSRAARPDLFVSDEDLKDPQAVAVRIKELAEKSRAEGFALSSARSVLVPTAGFSSANQLESYSSLLNDLLLERAVTRLARTLTALVEPRSQFLDAFFSFVSEIFQSEVLGIVIADLNSPWAAFKLNGSVSEESYQALLNRLASELELSKELSVDLRGDTVKDARENREGKEPKSSRVSKGTADDALSIKAVEILPVGAEKQGLGALVFAGTQAEFSPSAKAFMTLLKQEMKPLVQLLLAKQEIEILHSREAYRASIDSLTGLYNLEFLVGFLQQQLLFSFRQRLPVGMAIVDVDNFSKINETYGYEVGDSVLTNVANRILNLTRSSDLIARYGGDQFAVVLPNTDISGARVLAEKIRSEMEIVNFGQDDGKGPKVTVSVGCANFNMEDLNPETILRDAKLALRRG
jgi:diguanylate cyclase (GGDEF)-like protein